MMKVVITRHCVSSSLNNPDLSPLQYALMHASERVRVADAPTGAGKSHAFQYAMKQGQRVLFIVPTRRLAQNLAGGLIHDLVADGWGRDAAENKVAVWSSDASMQLREQGVLNICGHRVRQIQELDITRDGGEMIVGVPEVFSHLLLRRRMEAGQSAITVLDVLANFHHIVFDEFHTIEPRGFGLAAVCAKLAASFGWSRAKVSFLSATPLAIRPVLEKLGVSAGQIAELRETVGTEGRPLHGDVELGFSRVDTLAELVEAQKEGLAREVGAGRQVVVIYDKLGDLQRELSKLRQTLASIGIAPEQVLAINSIDDSGMGCTGTGFATGRYRNPDQFAVLIATASVEMGITFRAANLLFMEPGFEPMNFLQRYGRAARRGADGQVWVRCDDAMQNNKPWLRELATWVARHNGQRLDIEDLTTMLSRSKRNEFGTPLVEGSRYFGTLPSRAVYTAGLYWNALLRHPSVQAVQGQRREHLQDHLPDSAKAIYGWLKTVRRMESDRSFGASARKWCDRFEALAYTLRDIGERVRLIESDGRVIEADLLWLRRETNILERFPPRQGESGKDEICLPGTLDDYLLAERNRVRPMTTVFFPHTLHSAQLPKNGELVDAWCRNLKGRGDSAAAMAWEDFPEAMQAAEKLVRSTGLVVSDDETISVVAGSLVL
jgi:CRISPR-associated endonuclease/helicase Cas3